MQVSRVTELRRRVVRAKIFSFRNFSHGESAVEYGENCNKSTLVSLRGNVSLTEIVILLSRRLSFTRETRGIIVWNINNIKLMF